VAARKKLPDEDGTIIEPRRLPAPGPGKRAQKRKESNSYKKHLEGGEEDERARKREKA